jgi:hypothetical protein
MQMDRRYFSAALAALLGLAVAGQPIEATAQVLRRRRRRVRRRIRRRLRRRAVTRVVFGRPFWVVPVGLAIGWELVHDNRVVIVKETRIVEREGNPVEVAVVTDSAGRTEEIEIVREDTSENREELQGSVLAADDRTIPGVDAEIDEEVAD